MRNPVLMVVGGGLVLLGVVSLVSTLTGFDFGAICWPAGLIVVGVWLLVRPRWVRGGAVVEVKLLGDVVKRGAWQVNNTEYWLGIADVDLDLTQADIPPGETRLTFYGFIGDIDVFAPSSVAFQVTSQSFITSGKLPGGKEEAILAPVTYASPGYDQAERKLRIEAAMFLADVAVRQGGV
jgi:hypothetical protein